MTSLNIKLTSVNIYKNEEKNMQQHALEGGTRKSSRGRHELSGSRQHDLTECSRSSSAIEVLPGNPASSNLPISRGQHDLRHRRDRRDHTLMECSGSSSTTEVQSTTPVSLDSLHPLSQHDSSSATYSWTRINPKDHHTSSRNESKSVEGDNLGDKMPDKTPGKRKESILTDEQPMDEQHNALSREYKYSAQWRLGQVLDTSSSPTSSFSFSERRKEGEFEYEC